MKTNIVYCAKANIQQKPVGLAYLLYTQQNRESVNMSRSNDARDASVTLSFCKSARYRHVVLNVAALHSHLLAATVTSKGKHKDSFHHFVHESFYNKVKKLIISKL